MTTFSFYCFCILVALIVLQTGLMLKFYALFFGSQEPLVERDKLPKAAILLPLRGADPRLSETLTGLMSQDYPEYELHIILDHENDPSREFVDRAVAATSFKKVFVDSIKTRRKTCSPQCSALYEAARRLDESPRNRLHHRR